MAASFNKKSCTSFVAAAAAQFRAAGDSDARALLQALELAKQKQFQALGDGVDEDDLVEQNKRLAVDPQQLRLLRHLLRNTLAPASDATQHTVCVTLLDRHGEHHHHTYDVAKCCGRVVEDAHCLKLQLMCASDSVPELGMHTEYAVLSDGVKARVGVHRFEPARLGAAEFRAVHVPLYDLASLDKAKRLGLGACNLLLMVECALHDGASRYLLRGVLLECHLGASLQMQPALGRPERLVDAAGFDTVLLEPAARLPARAATLTKTVDKLSVDEFVATTLGPQAARSAWSVHAYHGREQIVGKASGERPLYALGEASAPLAMLSIVHQLVRASDGSGVVAWNFHDKRTLPAMLKRAGSERLWVAIEACYVGAGMSVPTAHHVMQHTAGLPEHVPLSSADIRAIMEGQPPEHREPLDVLVRAFERDVVPLSEPGLQQHTSMLGWLVLRACFRGWQQPGAVEKLVLEDLALLHAPSCSYRPSADRMAPCCPEPPRGCCLADHNALHELAVGLHADPAEVCRLLSDHNPWSPSDAGARRGAFGFMPAVCRPCVVLSEQDQTAAGFGWTHLTLDGHAVMCAVGYVPGHHCFVALRMPATRHCVVFATNADLAHLADTSRGTAAMKPLLRRLVALALANTRAPLEVDAVAAEQMRFRPAPPMRKTARRRLTLMHAERHVRIQAVLRTPFISAIEYVGGRSVSAIVIEEVEHKDGKFSYELHLHANLHIDLQRQKLTPSGRKTIVKIGYDEDVQLTVGARTVKGAFRLVNANGEPGEFLRITQVSVRNPDTNAELQLPQVMLAGIYYVTLPMLAIMARLDQAPYLKPVNAAPAPAVPNPAVVTTETFLNAIGSSVTAVGHAGVAELLTPQSPAARSTIENSMSARNLGAVGRAASDQLFMGRSTLRVATTLLPLSWMYGGDGNVVQAL